LYPYFDFDNVEAMLLKEQQKARDRLAQFGYLHRLVDVQSKCGAAHLATAGSSRLESWHDAPAFRFDCCSGALGNGVAVQQG